MSFYIQHGYGKAQKVQSLATPNGATGIILSPGDEDPANLKSTADLSRDLGLTVLVDPQSYVYSSLPPGIARNHSVHGLALEKLSWAQDAKSISVHVNAVGDLNRKINPDGKWIAPSVLQTTFSDVWTPLSIQFARTASESWGPSRTIVSVVVEESALAEWSRIEDWLDVVTSLDVAGFYLLVNRASTAYPPAPWSPIRLANLLRLIHTLGTVNRYEVIWGYSDLEGLLGAAAGASGIASGWSYTLRQFSVTKWQASAGGGKPATLRYLVPRLWSSLRSETEAASILQSTLRESIFRPSELESFTSKSMTAMTRADAQEQYLTVLSERANALDSLSSQEERLVTIEESLDNAKSHFESVANLGIILEPRYAARVQSLRDSLQLFRETERL